MSELTNQQLIASIVAYMVSKTPQPVGTSVNDQIVAIHEALAQEPPTLQTAIANLGELIKRQTPDNEHVAALVDATVDLSVYEPGESVFEDLNTGLSALINAVKAWKEERRENRKNGDD